MTYIDFVLDCSYSARNFLSGVYLFCNDFIRKMYTKYPECDCHFGITSFYGDNREVKIANFNEEKFTNNIYEFDRKFFELEISGGDRQGKENIVGGMNKSIQKFEDSEGKHIMILFSDSYVGYGDFDEIKLENPLHMLVMYLADDKTWENARNEAANNFWCLPLCNKNNRVDHSIKMKKCSLNQLFEKENREENWNREIEALCELVRKNR